MSWRLRSPRTLVASYPLNGHAEDVSGHGLDGTWSGTKAYAAFLKCSRQAADLAGTDDYVQLPLAAADFMDGQTAFSIACWFLADASPGVIFDFRDADNDGVSLEYIAAGIEFRVNTIDSVSAAAALGHWTHVVAVKEAAGVQRLYVDGEHVDTDDSSAETIAVTAPPRLGIDSYDLNGDFNGRIADVCLYNVALTSDEILTLMRMPVPTY